MSEAIVLHARADREDRLVSADPPLAAINERAGGAIGRGFAVPQFATLVRLARRMRILIARGVTIADADSDLDCWIKAVPDADGVALSITVLRERTAWHPPLSVAAVPPPPGALWTWETDAELRLTGLAPAAERHGVAAGEALAQPLTRLFAFDADAEGALPILDAVAERSDFAAQPATLRAGGERVVLAASVKRDVLGGFAGFVGGTFAAPDAAPPPRDASAALTGAFNARLEAILRSPLGRIVANADTINAATDGPLDPQYIDYAADIASAGRHLLGLVDDLVDLEAIEREDFAVEHEAIDLADVARRAAGLLAVRATDAGVTIDRGDLDRPSYATGEFRRALQIMVNLVGNAVRYSPRGGNVWIRLRRERGVAVAIVADQGKGIAADDQARIFEKFERVDPNEPGGNGLGLYIARRLARAMGGELTVDSAPGQGARFILSLPAA